jgi:hypothetical protein
MTFQQKTNRMIQAVVLLVTILAAPLAVAQSEPAEEPLGALTGTAAEEAGVEQQIQALTALDPIERADAAQALGEAGDPSAVPALLQTLRSDPVAEVRGWAVRALHQIGTPEATAAVSGAARGDADERVRSLASRLSGVPAAVPSAFDGAPQPQAQLQTYTPYPETYGIQGQSPYRHSGRARRPGFGLRLAGWITFGVTYGMSFLAAVGVTIADAEEGWPLFLPLVGPAIVGTQVWADDEDLAGVGILTWVISLAQIAGFTMALIGHVRRSRARNNEEPEPSRSARGLTLVASGPGGTPGLGLAGWF